MLRDQLQSARNRAAICGDKFLPCFSGHFSRRRIAKPFIDQFNHLCRALPLFERADLLKTGTDLLEIKYVRANHDRHTQRRGLKHIMTADRFDTAGDKAHIGSR